MTAKIRISYDNDALDVMKASKGFIIEPSQHHEGESVRIDFNIDGRTISLDELVGQEVQVVLMNRDNCGEVNIQPDNIGAPNIRTQPPPG